MPARRCIAGPAWSGVLFAAALVVTPVLAASARCGDATVQSAHGCCGDCDASGRVTVDEILTVVNIALGTQALGEGCAGGCVCGAIASQVCVNITVDVIVQIIDNALRGCPATGELSGVEECDDGGLCFGGPSAGLECTGEDDCDGDLGVCVGGLLEGTACEVGTSSCATGSCIKCRPVGGDGCAANCTAEREITYTLVPGVLNFGQGDQFCETETSCTTTYLAIVSIPLALDGEIQLAVGKEVNGLVPVVVKPFRKRYFENAYLRGVAVNTCGGTLFEPDGTLSPTCDVGLTSGLDCPAQRRCAPAFGPTNAAAGMIGCDGLEGVESRVVVDCGGVSPPDEPTGFTRSGFGPAGSAFLYAGALIDIVAEESGHNLRTENDAPAGDLFLLPLTTGATFSAVHNLLGHRTRVSDLTNPPTQTFGKPFDCSDLEHGITSGAVLIGASGACGEESFLSYGPLVVKLVAQ